MCKHSGNFSSSPIIGWQQPQEGKVLQYQHDPLIRSYNFPFLKISKVSVIIQYQHDPLIRSYNFPFSKVFRGFPWSSMVLQYQHDPLIRFYSIPRFPRFSIFVQYSLIPTWSADDTLFATFPFPRLSRFSLVLFCQYEFTTFPFPRSMGLSKQ